MGVEADDGRVPIFQVSAEPFHLVGVHVRHRHLHSVGEVENDGFFRGGLPDLHHRLADFQGKLDLGGGETFWRILKGHLGASEARNPVLDPAGAAPGNFNDLRLFESENDAALGWGGGIVEMDDGALCADQGFHGALDKIFTGLNQHLNGHVIRDPVGFDQLAHEPELGVGSGRKTDFDLFEAAADEGIEHFEFLADVHRFGEGLVAVPEIDAAPEGGMREDPRRPEAVRQVHRGEGAVLAAGVRDHGVGEAISRAGSCKGLLGKNRKPPSRGPPDCFCPGLRQNCTCRWMQGVRKGGGRVLAIWPRSGKIGQDRARSGKIGQDRARRLGGSRRGMRGGHKGPHEGLTRGSRGAHEGLTRGSRRKQWRV